MSLGIILYISLIRATWGSFTTDTSFYQNFNEKIIFLLIFIFTLTILIPVYAIFWPILILFALTNYFSQSRIGKITDMNIEIFFSSIVACLVLLLLNYGLLFAGVE